VGVGGGVLGCALVDNIIMVYITLILSVCFISLTLQLESLKWQPKFKAPCDVFACETNDVFKLKTKQRETVSAFLNPLLKLFTGLLILFYCTYVCMHVRMFFL
jgi:hypothetical protein